MSTNNLNQRLIALKQIKDSLLYLFKEEFQTVAEFQTFKDENKKDFEKYKNIIQEIKELEWQLMSPQERKEFQEYIKVEK